MINQIDVTLMSPEHNNESQQTELTKLDDITCSDEQPLCDSIASTSSLAALSTTASLSDKFTKFHFFSPPQSTADLLPIPQEMQIYLFGVLSSRYLKEV